MLYWAKWFLCCLSAYGFWFKQHNFFSIFFCYLFCLMHAIDWAYGRQNKDHYSYGYMRFAQYVRASDAERRVSEVIISPCIEWMIFTDKLINGSTRSELFSLSCYMVFDALFCCAQWIVRWYGEWAINHSC